MLLHFATSLSRADRSSPLAWAIYTLSVLLLSIKGVEHTAAAETLSNSPAPIKSEVSTPAENLQRICVALCTAGLGGPPCESYHCADLFSSNVKNAGDRNVDRYSGAKRVLKKDPNHGRPPGSMVPSVPSTATPRRKVCLKLCEYSLGFPLCECEAVRKVYPAMDLDCVCAMFCIGYGYHLDGCPVCAEVLTGPGDGSADKRGQNNHWKEPSACSLTTSHNTSGPEEARGKIDWNQWCIERCSEGDGGAACNCDILPLNLQT